MTVADLNRVFLIGRLTADPELRRTGNGTAVTDLRLATSNTWTGKDGEKREEKLYVDITCWDKTAELACQYLRKGSSLHVEGSLKMSTWDDKNTGEKRSKIGVTAERIQFLDPKPRDQAPRADAPRQEYRQEPARSSSSRPPAAATTRYETDVHDGTDPDGDIPF